MKNFIYKFRYLLLVLFCTLIFLFINNTNVQAYTYEGYEFPEFPEGFEDSKYKVIVYYPNQNKYSLYLYSNGNTWFYVSDTEAYLQIQSGYTKYSWSPGNNGWNLDAQSSKGLRLTNWVGYASTDEEENKELIYCNINLPLNSPDNNEIFFYKTPLMSSTNMQYLLGANICQMIPRLILGAIPVGLIILSMVLVIYLVRLVILRVI